MGGKVAGEAGGERGRGVEADGRLAERVAEAAHVHGGRQRAVGEHHVELVDGELAEQGVELALAADDAHRLGQIHRWRQQQPRDRLRHHVGDAHAEGHGTPGGAALQRFLELVAEAEDLLGVVQHHASGLGQHQAAALALEEVHAEIGLQRGDLARQGLRRQPGTFRGAHDPTRTGHGPEMMELLVVQHGSPPAHAIRYFGKIGFKFC